MRLESVSIILAIALASGIAYAWWVARARRRREPDLKRDGVLGKATVTGVGPAGDGAVLVEYRFRHPAVDMASTAVIVRSRGRCG